VCSSDLTGSLQESSQETVFAVGTGTADNARRNAIHIDNNGNTEITGSVTISGSLQINGQPVVTGSIVIDKTGLITTGSFLGAEQSISGSLTLSNNNVNNTMLRVTGGILTSGSINNMNVWRGPTDVGQNLGIGFNALQKQTSAGTNVLAVGASALANNISGSNLVAIGTLALNNNIASNNVAIGGSSMTNNTLGFNNVAIGGNSLSQNLDATNNVGIGSDTLQLNVSGSNNIAIGATTMVNTRSSNNTGIGYQALYQNTVGANNTGIGNVSLQNNVTGSNNVAIGNTAGRYENSNNNFYVNAIDRSNLNAERSGSLMYGTFNSTVANQTLQINAATDIRNNLVVSGSLSVGGNLQFNVGDFYSTQTQSGSANVSGSVTYNNTGISNGVTLASNSRLTIANSGVYSITFSAQLKEVGGTDTIYLWLKKNGTNVADTGTKTVVRNNDENIMTVEYIVQSSASDYYEIVYQNLNGHAQLYYETASGNIPATPSIIITVKQVR
jgi:hypothetical protein